MNKWKFVLFSTLLFLLTACNKADQFNYPAGTVGHSRIIYYPSVSIKGDRLILVPQGSTFTEPGVTATLNGQSTPYTTSGTVDANTPGIYNLNYEAKNLQGYTASDWRTVVVISKDVASNDFTGTYLRAATGVTSTWLKTANGVYIVDNPGGAGVGVGYKVIVVNYKGYKIKIPHQLAVDPSGNTGIVSSTNETYTAIPKPSQYSWVFLAGGYGTSLRTFVKQ